jgi:putative hydrolase of the HAD superfamily
MAGPSRVRAIAFDLFHTLVDPEELRPKEFVRARAVAELLGLPLPAFEAYWAETQRARQVGAVPTSTERVRQFCSASGIVLPNDVWPRVSELLSRYADAAVRTPHAQIVHALQRLKRRGIVLGLVSNCEECEIGAWPESALAPLFDATVFSCQVGCAKPSPEAYRALVPRWGGIPLGEAVFVGDGSNDEIGGARRAGFRWAIFDSEFVSRNGLRSPEENDRIQSQADRSIRNLDDLERLLRL